MLTAAVAVIGGWLTDTGAWYQLLVKPDWTPSGSLISFVWTTIFVLAALSALVVFNVRPAGRRRQAIMTFFVANGLLNIGWSWIFFVQHWLWGAVIEALWLGLSVVCLVILIWPHQETEEEVFGAIRKKSLNRLAAGLLLPYLAWVIFATYLAYKIWILNWVL